MPHLLEERTPTKLENDVSVPLIPLQGDEVVYVAAIRSLIQI